MADRIRDPYGFTDVDAAVPATAVTPMTTATGGLHAVAENSLTPDRTRVVDDVITAPVADAGLPGSPLDTVWGSGDTSYMTDEQRKLMRQIQGKFDASMQRRDRELARWGAPYLSSYANDEALARAIAAAQGLNYREETPEQQPVLPPWYNQSQGGNTPRVPTTPTSNTRPPTEADTYAEWQKILGGLTSIIPLLLGKGGLDSLMNKGLLSWAWDAITKGAKAEDILSEIQNAAGSTVDYSSFYGPDSGWGNDLIQTPSLPDYTNDMWDWGGSGTNWLDVPAGDWWTDLGTGNSWDYGWFAGP